MILFPVLFLNLRPPLKIKVSLCIPETQDVAKTGLRLEELVPPPASCIIGWMVYEHSWVPACCAFSEPPEEAFRALLTHSPLHPFATDSYLLSLKLAWRPGRFSNPCLPNATWPCPAFYVGAGVSNSGPHDSRASTLLPTEPSLQSQITHFCQWIIMLSIERTAWKGFNFNVNSMSTESRPILD